MGLDNADSVREDTYFVLSAMTKAILQSPEFEGFENFGHPFGLILYYLFTFIVMVILLNILIGTPTTTSHSLPPPANTPRSPLRPSLQ